MNWRTIAIIVSSGGSFILVLVYIYLYLQERQRSLGLWAIGWGFYLVHFFEKLLIQSTDGSKLLLFINDALVLASGIMLLWGTNAYLGKKFSRLWILAFASGTAWSASTILLDTSQTHLCLPFFLLVGGIYVWTGMIILMSREVRGIGKTLTGCSFIIWGLNKADYPFVRSIEAVEQWYFLLTTLNEVLIACGIILIYFEQSRYSLMKTQDLLRKSELQFRRLTENAVDIIFRMTLPEGHYDYISPAVAEITGYVPDEYYRSPELMHTTVLHPDWRDYFKDQWQNLLQGVMLPSYEYQIVHKSGEMKWLFQRNVLVRDEKGNPSAIEGIVSDITERKSFEEQIVYQANHDHLTGLPNRNLLHDRLEQALAFEYHHNGALALLLLDLDNFKMINDTFGHLSGDVLLKQMASRLKQFIRQYDTVARLGGDEFVVIVSDPEKNLDIGRIAERMLSIFETPMLIKDREVFVTASVGIATFPADGDNAEMLLKNADAAMFHAKKLGKNTYQFFTESMNSDVHERLAMETKLRRALERQEFFLHYQPRVEISSGKVIGMEALLRWQPETGNVIPPDDFIPLLEDTGLIVPVGEWVLSTACSQNKAWQDAGLPPLRIAVNISARHFSQENLPDKVAQILYDTGLGPECLEIEITESIIMKDVAESTKKLDALKKMGVTLSIDDFGTGYSSLNYLKRFPIDILKIDHSFVDGIPFDSSDSTIAITVIAMAHNLKMTVVAEGVESEEQLNFLAANGCEEFQGYYFSKPLAAEDFADFIRMTLEARRELADIGPVTIHSEFSRW